MTVSATSIPQPTCISSQCAIPEKFPDFSDHFFEIGKLSSSDGTGYCVFTPGLTIDLCDQIIAEMDMESSFLRSPQKNGMQRNCQKDIDCTNGDGFHFQNKKGFFGSTSVNPQKKENLQNALDFMNHNMLVGDYFEKPTEEIVQDIKHLHTTLFQNLERFDQRTEKIGKYRTEMAGYPLPIGQGDQMFFLFKNEIEKNGGRPEHIEAIDYLKMRNDEYQNFDRAFAEITDAEKEALGMTGLFFTLPEKIEKEMTAYVEGLKEYSRAMIYGEMDLTYDAAAYAHSELYRINPFNRGNEQISGLMTSLMGFHGGLDSPIHFFDEKSYEGRLWEATKDFKKFVTYIQNSYSATKAFAANKLSSQSWLEWLRSPMRK